MATVLIMALKEESQGLFEKHNVTPYYCGIGLINAAHLTQKLITENKAHTVINLGTAGSHKLPVGSLVECTSFVQRVPHHFYSVKGKKITVEPSTELQTVTCGSADFIDKVQPLVECDIMDMEAYAMAYVCQQLKVKFTSIKYITDNSDENKPGGLRENWLAQLEKGSLALWEQYKKLI